MPPAHNGSTGNGTSTLLSILHGLANNQARQGETLARVDSKTDTMLSLALSSRSQESKSKLRELFFSLIGHWGVVSGSAVALYKLLWPHARLLLGL